MSDTSTEERPEERPDVRPGARRDAGPHDTEVVVTQRELRNRSGEIMRGVEQGRRYLITSNGAPVGELTPRHRRHFTPRALVAETFAGAPPVDLARLRTDLDAFAAQDTTPRTATGTVTSTGTDA